MENVAIGFYIPLLIHHGTTDIVMGYQHLTTVINDTSLRVFGDYGFRYLTIWNLILQTCYLNSSIICYVLGRIQYKRCMEYSEKLGIILKFVNVSVASPVAAFIVLLFWMVYTINRELVYPAIIDELLPVWLNYSMHAVIIVLPLVEVFLQRTVRMPLFKHSVLALTLFIVVYGFVLFGTYHFEGIWLYPFLDKISWPCKVYFVFASYVVCVSLLALTTTVHRSVFSRTKVRD